MVGDISMAAIVPHVEGPEGVDPMRRRDSFLDWYCDHFCNNWYRCLAGAFVIFCVLAAVGMELIGRDTILGAVWCYLRACVP